MSRKANNDYLERQKQQMQLEQAKVVDLAMKKTHLVISSMCRDAAMMACNRAFGIGKGRMGKFLTEYEKALDWMAQMQVMDVDENNDPNFGYTKSKIDAVIKELMPDDMFCKFEDRYYFEPDSVGRKSI